MSTGHAADISASAVSGDGSFFVSASRDNTLKLWDSSTGNEMLTLEGHPKEVLYCAVGRDNLVYSAGPASGFDAVVKVWDPSSGKEVGGWTLQEIGEIKGLALSPDGTYVATLVATGYVDLFEPATGKKLRRFDAGSGADDGTCLISPDGAFIVVSAGRDVQVIDPASTDLGHSFNFPDYGRQALGITPDAKSVVFVEKDKGWVVADMASGTSTVIADDGLFSACAISPDGSLIAACCSTVEESWNSLTGSQRSVEASSVRIRRTDSGETVHDFDLGGQEANLCAFSPDGSLVFATTAQAFKIWDADSGEDVGSIPLEAEPTSLVLHPSQPIAALGDAVGGFQVLDLGIDLAPIIVSAEDQGAGLAVHCPACTKPTALTEAQLGREISCQSCGAALRVNAFSLSLRWEPFEAMELDEPGEEEAKRLAQARNRALFSVRSVEELEEMAQEQLSTPAPRAQAPAPVAPQPTEKPKKEKRGFFRRRAKEPAPTATPAADQPTQLTPLNEQIRAIILESLAESGVDLDEFPPGAGPMIPAFGLDMALKILVASSRLFLDAKNVTQLNKVVAGGDPGEIIGFLNDALPPGEALSALKESLKTVLPEAAKMVKDNLGQITGGG